MQEVELQSSTTVQLTYRYAHVRHQASKKGISPLGKGSFKMNVPSAPLTLWSGGRDLKMKFKRDIPKN